MKKEIFAISMLSGTIIGVGLFALPYIALQVGFWAILAYFLVLGIVVISIHLLFGELALKTPDKKRLPGFAKIYLGKKGEIFVYFTSTISLLGALLAYLIVGGEFLFELLSPHFGGTIIAYTLLYFIIGSLLILFDTKAIEKVEFWGLILFLVALFVIFLKGADFINIQNLFLGKISFDNNWFLPYGPILFSLWGLALIPEIEEMLSKKKEVFLKIIPISILLPAIVYLFFIVLILGISGEATSESALTSLKNVLGNGIVALTLFFGILTTFTSLITLGLNLKKILWYDLGLNRYLAWAFSSFLPLFLFLIGIKKFIPLISFLGGIMIGLEGILVLAMYQRAFKVKISSLKFFLILVLFFFLSGGIIYEIFKFLK